MSDASTGKTGQELVRAARGRFAAGEPSANPTGRPKRGETRAEQVRRNVDWEKADARLQKIVLNPRSKDSDAIAAYRELSDRGWGRPLSSHELTVHRGEDTSGTSLVASMTDEQIAERLAWLRGQRELPESSAIDAESAPANPSITEGSGQ